MKDLKFDGTQVRFTCEKLPKPKKLTGTRFGAVLGVNTWQTPFQAWCEMTKAWVKPYESTKYTEAGKVIEDKQLTWFSRYKPVVYPEDIYGKDFFNTTFGDFFKDSKVFGGMWDGLTGTKEEPDGVIECKTTKRAEDWQNDIPEYYALQASLYAYLLGLEDVYMIVTFLDEGDYDHPDKFVCTVDNTAYVHFKVHERYPKFDSYVEYCTEFYYRNVLGGVSPDFDEKKDKEYLDGLRTGIVTEDTDIDALVAEAEELYLKIEEVEDSIKADKKRLSTIECMLKEYAITNEHEDQQKTVFKGGGMTWVVSKSQKKSVDSDRMKKDGIYENYVKIEDTYTIRKSVNKESEEA